MTDWSGTLLVHLRVAGLLLAVVAVINVFVPGYLRWRQEMTALSLVNRQIFQAHGFFIVLVIGLCSALLLVRGEALLEPSPLSRAILSGLTLFWGLRMLAQWFYYSPSLWRGHRFHTAVHCVFSMTWVYVTGTFAAALWHGVSAAG